MSLVCAPSQLAPTTFSAVSPSLDFDDDFLLNLVEKQSNLQRLSPAELRETFTFSVQVLFLIKGFDIVLLSLIGTGYFKAM